MWLALWVSTASADGCYYSSTSTGGSTGITFPLAFAINGDIPEDGALSFLDYAGTDGVLSVADQTGAPIETDETVIETLSGAVRLLTPTAGAWPDTGDYTVSYDGTAFQTYTVLAGASEAPPPLTWASADFQRSSSSYSSCGGTMPDGWMILSAFGTEASLTALVYPVEDASAPIDDAEVYLAFDPARSVSIAEDELPCFVGRWIGADGALGDAGEAICVETVGGGCGGCDAGGRPLADLTGVALAAAGALARRRSSASVDPFSRVPARM